MITLRAFARRFANLLLVAVPIAVPAAWAQSAGAYPGKPIRLVVPFAPGGALDVVGRIVGAKLTESWSRQVLIDNRLGAAGNIGAEFVARAAPDGYTLLMSSVTTQAIGMSLLAKPPYDFVRDYAPVALVASAPLALVCTPGAAGENGAGIHRARQGASRRAQLLLIGHRQRHASRRGDFRSARGSQDDPRAVQGGAQGVTDLLSGQVQFAFSTIGLAQPHVDSGRLRMIAIGSTRRYSRLPNLPTVAESGVKTYSAEQWYGVVAPAGTPSPIVGKLAAEIKAIVAQPDVRERFYSQGIEPAYAPPEEFGGYIKASVVKYAKIVKDLGLQPE